MFQDNYDHGLMRKYFTYFASLFTNVYVDRQAVSGANTGQLIERMQVPLHFADVEHFLERVIEDPNITKGDAITLPAMAWNFIDMKYAGDRHQTSRQRFSQPIQNDPNRMLVMHAPAPYDFHFRLAVLVKNINDGLDIIEGIAPYFTPDYTNRLELIPEMNLTQDIPVVLEQCSMDFDVPKEYKERVTFVWNLDFTLQGYLYGPEKKWPLIKFSTVDYFIAGANGISNDTIVLSTTAVPGLLPNGQPANNSTANLSLNALSISITSNYAYIDTVNSSPREG